MMAITTMAMDENLVRLILEKGAGNICLADVITARAESEEDALDVLTMVMMYVGGDVLVPISKLSRTSLADMLSMLTALEVTLNKMAEELN